MGFIADIEARTQSERAAILAHQFVTGVGDGTLPVEKFKHYVTQDYVYLIDYSRALALASAKAPMLDDMSWFAGLLDETLNVEMALHREYCREFDISAEELEATVGAPSNVAYTNFLNVADISINRGFQKWSCFPYQSYCSRRPPVGRRPAELVVAVCCPGSWCFSSGFDQT